ncbi:MAG: CPBP family intramembrane metalloprotease [Clostridia bacterium]|nr:CPBP family intramembrane metalloprotease [Clostridia bacterium]
MKKKFSFGDFALNILKCFAYFITWYGISNVVVALYQICFRQFTGTNDLDAINNAYQSNAVALTIIANCLTIFIFIFAYKKKGISLFERTSLKRTNILTGVHSALFGMAFLLVINLLLILLAKVAPESWFTAHNEQNMSLTTANSTIRFLAVALIAPLTEEILFRGLIASALERSLPRWVAIILSSLIFGFVHGTIISLIYATILGIFMCWLYFKTGSLLSSILFHMGFNVVSYFLTGESISLFLVGLCILVVIYEIIYFNRYKG